MTHAQQNDDDMKPLPPRPKLDRKLTAVSVDDNPGAHAILTAFIQATQHAMVDASKPLAMRMPGIIGPLLPTLLMNASLANAVMFAMSDDGMDEDEAEKVLRATFELEIIRAIEVRREIAAQQADAAALKTATPDIRMAALRADIAASRAAPPQQQPGA